MYGFDMTLDLDPGCARYFGYSISSADRPAGWLAPIIDKMYVIDFKYVVLFLDRAQRFEEIKGVSVGDGIADLS